MSEFWQRVLTSSMVFAFFMLSFLAAYLIINVRQMRKRHALLTKFHEALKPGKKVVVSGGLVGKLIKIDAEYAEVELNKGNVITVARYGIQDILD